VHQVGFSLHGLLNYTPFVILLRAFINERYCLQCGAVCGSGTMLANVSRNWLDVWGPPMMMMMM
jgi:hypothetical protein